MASTKDWRNLPIDKWNTLSFTEYLKDMHREILGIEYAPMRNWRFEQGQIGTAIGTKTKEGIYPKEVIKRFIEECMRTYKPSYQYPGTNFGFMYSYRKNVLQRIEKEYYQETQRKHIEEQAIKQDLDEYYDWL